MTFCGAYFSGQWIHFPWPETWIESDILKDITFLEFFSVVLKRAVWGNRPKNKKIKFNIDNLALVEILNSQTSKSNIQFFALNVFLSLSLDSNGRGVDD